VPRGRVVLLALACALGLRLWLVHRAEVISVDGVQYLEVAQLLRAGAWQRALRSFYPPGYPLAIAAVEPLAGGWERAGLAVSVAAGTLAVAPLAGIARLVGLDGVALAAALLGLALAPYPARYAADVRSEALYGLLLLAAVWAAAAALARSRRTAPMLGGLAIGLAYLVRPEGLLLVLPLGGGLAAARRGRAAAALALVAAVVAAPYVLYLRADTGRWIVSRKAANVLSLGIRAGSGEGVVVSQGDSDRTGLVAVVRANPRAFAKKLLVDSGRTFAAFADCLFVAYVPFLLVGFVRVRRRAPAVGRLLHAVTWFYVALFALTYVDRRFYAGLVGPAMVWCGDGFAWLWERLARRGRAAQLGAAAALAALAVGKALGASEAAAWVRELGGEIAREGGPRQAIAARDLRVAYYAGGRTVEVPFPIDGAHLAALLDGGAGWLVVLDGDLAPDGAATLARRAVRVRRVPLSKGRTADLYRLPAPP